MSSPVLKGLGPGCDGPRRGPSQPGPWPFSTGEDPAASNSTVGDRSYEKKSLREGLPPRPCVDTSRAAEYYYSGGSYEEFQHPKRMIRTVKKMTVMRRFIIDKMPLIFSTPPLILATYHYWQCLRCRLPPPTSRARLVMRTATGQRASLTHKRTVLTVGMFASLCWLWWFLDWFDVFQP